MTSTTFHLHFSTISSTHHRRHHLPTPIVNLSPFSSTTTTTTTTTPLRSKSNLIPHPRLSPFSGGGDAGKFPPGDGGGDDNHNNGGDDDEESFWEKLGVIGMFIRGWRERVSADPQFPFKVLMEEVVGVTSCVIGDMASRPNFGLNELDFVFSTIVVGSILNFTLMYLLAPTAAASALSTAAFPSHVFQSGNFGLAARAGSLVYKGALFAAVGFAAGLVGTAIGNGLIAMRKRIDPEFETPNKAPPPVLNAITWAGHMALSSNLRYQTLNGVEYALEKAVSPGLFKTAVVALRCANNLLGGVSFVALARLTGSQSVSSGEVTEAEEDKAMVVSEAVSLPSDHST